MRSSSPNSASSKKLLSSSSPRSAAIPVLPPPENTIPPEAWLLDDSSINDMDHFVKALAGIRSKGARPDLLGSIISHYAPKWLPELSNSIISPTTTNQLSAPPPPPSPSPVAAWAKKKFIVETLVRVLPPEREAVPCGFILRLLRVSCMVGAEQSCMEDLESRASRSLDQATLKEVMIPAFSHTSGTLLDVDLMLRLVMKFVGLDEASRSSAATVKVAKLVDCYLAEAAIDSGLVVEQFQELAKALPAHARATDDGLYRAIDTFIKAHPSTSKEERKGLCRLIDTRKLSPEVSLHAAQNERLPVRSVIQVLFSEHAKLNRSNIDWSGSFNGLARSPNLALDLPTRVPSKREVLVHQQEMRRLREDVARLQIQCQTLQAQLDRLAEKKKKGFFRWSSFLFRGTDLVDEYDESATEHHRTPMAVKRVRNEGKGSTPKSRNSLS